MLKSISPKSLVIFRKLMEGLNNVGDSRRFGDFGDAFMPVSVEIIGRPDFPGKMREEAKLVSVAHYFEQQGDYVADPDVVFLTGKDAAYPMVFQQGGIPPIYQETAKIEGGVIHLNEKAQLSLTIFCNEWFTNLAEQQGLFL